MREGEWARKSGRGAEMHLHKVARNEEDKRESAS